MNANADHQPRFYDNASKNLNFNPVVEFDEAAQDANYADFMDIASNGILPDGNTPYEVYAVIVPGAGNLTTPGSSCLPGRRVLVTLMPLMCGVGIQLMTAGI